MVVDKIGGGNDIERSSGSILHTQRLGITQNLAISLNADAALGLQASLDTLLFYAIDNSRQFVDAHTFALSDTKHIGLQLGVEINIKGQSALFRGRQPYNDGVVGLRGKHGALVLHTIIGIRGGSQGIA